MATYMYVSHSEQWKRLGTYTNSSRCIQVGYRPWQWIHVQSLKHTCSELVIITLLIKDTAQLLSEPRFLCELWLQFPDNWKFMIQMTPTTSHVQPTTAQTKTEHTHYKDSNYRWQMFPGNMTADKVVSLHLLTDCSQTMTSWLSFLNWQINHLFHS